MWRIVKESARPERALDVTPEGMAVTAALQMSHNPFGLCGSVLDVVWFSGLKRRRAICAGKFRRRLSYALAWKSRCTLPGASTSSGCRGRTGPACRANVDAL